MINHFLILGSSHFIITQFSRCSLRVIFFSERQKRYDKVSFYDYEYRNFIHPVIFGRDFLYASLFYPVMLSIVSSHQEHRFLLSCLPLINLSIARFWSDSLKNGRLLLSKRFWKYSFLGIHLLQVFLTFFLLRYHQVCVCCFVSRR